MSSGEVDVSTGSDMEEKPVEVVVPKKVKGRPRKTDASPKKPPEKKSYRCDRCNFSSSSKAKYTKHAKSAHSGTIVQCDHCEFKTPYKWNLDRHYKNHLGGGALCCHLCNFSCDIKQSLTVHLQNHHSNVPEEIIESVKRQQIPSRNSKNNNNVTINNNVENGNLSSSEEKKVPPLRISRSLTGLSLGDENISEKEDDESPSPIPSETVASNEASSSDSGGDEKRSQKCEMCDFEVSGDGGSIMKKHMATHHKSGKHKDHHKKRTPSSSPEYQPSKPSPNLLLPHTLPPKSTKGATVPKVGAPAESTSPSLHRSQSPLKATEAIHVYSTDMDTSETGLSKPISLTATADSQSISTLPQQSQSNTEKGSAFTAPGHDFSPSIFSSLKKPKQRALASFYEKINQKLSSAISKPADIPVETAFPTAAVAEAQATCSTGNNAAAATVATKSNRCQYCRQRCKSSVDLATHLEKCSDARVMRKGEGGDETEQVPTVKVATEKADEGAGKKLNQDENIQALPKPPSTAGKPTPTATTHKGVEIEEGEEGDYDSKVQLLNGSSDSDGLIGFETAPGVGAIHTGKMDEMEYQGYPGSTDPATECREVDEGNGNQSSPPGNDEEEEEEEEDDDAEEAEGNECVMKGGKSMITTRKVYRCPEADCTFWATTASRFHVHIVGHYNLKPFECSECHYKSNWRWDVNKHIRLKTPKDTKHAKAKTLLTHESGQRDYRKYDNYLVTMALTHSANAKAPDCSTVASKRTRNTVSTPKSSPELPTQKEGNLIITNEDVIAPHTPAVSSKQKVSKSGKVSGTSSSSSSHSTPTTAPQAEQSTSFIHPSSSSITQHQEESSPLAADMASSSTSPGGGNKSEGRSFVETRMHAGGEIYQTSILDQDMKHGNDEVDQEEMEVDNTPSGVDLTLKRPCPREDDLESQEVVTMHTQQMPKKKSRLQQQQHQREDPGIGNSGSGATNGSKTQSMWQCIKCSFKHPNKDVVNSHILELHKPKKGDPVSLLSHNHLIQVLIPEHDVGHMGNNDENSAYSLKKEAQQMYTENGKVLSCKHCPFSTGLLYEMEIHVEHHCSIRSNSYFSCPHCSYSVPVRSELQEHLKLHGDSLLQLKHQAEIQNKRINSSTVISSTTELKQSLLSPTSTTPEPLAMKKQKKYNCMECPYTTNSIGQFHYHTQSHEPRDYPFKCHRCSFNVSVKLHLLQHLRVHGIQIDEIGIPLTQQEYNDAEDLSEDANAQQSMEQEEPLNLSIFANRKPFVVWDANGIPMEMYRCQVCPQVFQDLNDLREHEFVNNHRSSINNGSSSNSRQCDSPPCEAVNLSLKSNSKKSSQSNHKVNNNTPAGNRSVTNTSSTAASSTPVPILSPTLNIESGGSSPSSKSERESLYLCDECPARFFFEKELKIHHTFHENKSTFQCPKCSYSARQKDPHLMSHMRVHGAAYQEKTKALLVRFPKAKVNFGTSSTAPSNLSAASILNSTILNAAGYFQSSFGNSGVSSMMRSGSISPPEQSHHPESVKKNGLSIVCPKCPEKFYSPTTYQQHIGLHGNPTEFRCRYCDYCAHSRKSLTVHELVHSGSADLSMESSTTPFTGSLSSGKSSSAFSPVSMMALVAHQDSAFSAAVSTGDNGNDDKNNGPVPDEAYEGNPEFVYPTYMKNGRVKSKRYKCMKCPSAFEKKDQYHTHIGLHGSNQKYKCTVCDYAVTYYANYIQHLKKHESQRNIPSDLLNPKALAKKGLLPEDDDGSGSIIPKMLKLSDVGENSVNSNGSLDSIESQNGGKCSFCPFQCFDDATLEAHLVHHQENQNWLHVCNICTFRTSSKKSLKEHSKLHLLSSFQNFKNISQFQQQQQQNQKYEELVVGGGKVAAGFDYGKLERKQQYEQYSNGVHDQQPHRHHLPQNDNDSSNGSL